MFEKIFQNEDVMKTLKEISNRLRYQDKNIPISISEEKMDVRYYSLLMFIDSLFKFYIIVGEDTYLSMYLEQVDKLLKKVENHNDIKVGINKLLITFSKMKLKLSNTTSCENKKILLDYFYEKYIVNGYLFHSFPSKFFSEVQKDGLFVNYYTYGIERLQEIENIFNKYGLENVFQKELNSIPYLAVTDSPFLGAYYAYYSPQYLNDFTTYFLKDGKNYDTSAFFRKDLTSCKNNVKTFMEKQHILKKDKQKVLSFLEEEWNLLEIEEKKPIISLIPRRVLNKNYLQEYQELEEELDKNELFVVITKLLDTRLNHFKVENNIPSNVLSIISLPTPENLGIIHKEKKEIDSKNPRSEFINQYGNTTIIALLGVLFITLGLTIMIILIGR